MAKKMTKKKTKKLMIKHKVIERKEYVFSIFFTVITLFFLVGITSFMLKTGVVYYGKISYVILPLIWISWILFIIKNKLWKPKKIKYIEHVINDEEVTKELDLPWKKM